MPGEVTKLSPQWSDHGNHPVLVRVGDSDWLIYQRLGDGAGQVVAHQVGGDDERLVSDQAVDCCGIAAAAGERVLIVCSQLTDGVYQLHAGDMDGEEAQQITDGTHAAISPQLAADSAGTLYLVYQSADRDHGAFTIYLRRLRDGEWSEPAVVSDTTGNNWCPALTCCSDGRIAVAWDGHAAGSYDVYLRFVETDLTMHPTMRLTDDEAFAAHANLSPAPNGAVWVAWNRGTAEWGKDNHPYRKGRIFENNYLHARRFIEVRRVLPERVLPVFPDVQCDVLDMALPGQHHERPRLLSMPNGLLCMGFRYNQGEPTGGHRNEKRWQTMLTWYDGRSWSGPVEMESAHGLSTGGIALSASHGGNLLVAASGERETTSKQDLETRVWQYRCPLPTLEPTPADPPIEAGRYPVTAKLERPQRHSTSHRGRTYQLYFGDTHRHTELSFCRCSIDGSLEEVFRYARDAAGMDFAMSADHDHQEKSPDLWMEVMQAADRFNVPGHFSTFFGYEWIGGADNRRHRNVISTQRVPPPPFEPDLFVETERRGRVGHRDVRGLWGTLERGKAITVAHHTACPMSLLWGSDPGEAADPELESLVEIFQASRGSSEFVGAPTLCNHFDRSGQYRGSFTIEEGTVATALAQGLRMGFIASSDHMSTHQSYACVYATENTRAALMEAMIARRTYAASDRIQCEFRLGSAFMGEAVGAEGESMKTQIRFVGTGPIREVMLLRDCEPYLTWTPDTEELEIEQTLPTSECKGHYFYARMIQKDTNLAWSSPIWID